MAHGADLVDAEAREGGPVVVLERVEPLAELAEGEGPGTARACSSVCG
jgi:hypothetical protein